MKQEDKIILYTTGSGNVTVSVRFEDDNFLMTQKAIAELFETTTANINIHIKNILDDEELDADSTIKDFLIVQTEGSREVSRKVQFYSLDMIIAEGYRVNSKKATRFRQWATKTLHEYIQKGFVLNDELLTLPHGKPYLCLQGLSGGYSAKNYPFHAASPPCSSALRPLPKKGGRYLRAVPHSAG
ncbi:MAG: virulence RhuM family protein [Eubacteriales bacterium]